MFDGISTVIWKTIAGHGLNWVGVQNLAHSVDSARPDLLARVDALSVDTSLLNWTFVVCSATHCKKKKNQIIRTSLL